VVFSVKFPDRQYAGQSVLCGPGNNEIVFLHGGTLARYKLTGQPVWSVQVLDTNLFVKQAQEEINAIQGSN
ncbi:MAG: hypothetical protein ACREIC_30200, partial [Limisphaerales bacterium]